MMQEKEKPKQWIILRKDLGMRKGKMVAQGAHASMKVIFDLWKGHETFQGNGSALHRVKLYMLAAQMDNAVQEWIDGCFTKITLSVDSEEELVGVYEKAKEANLPCSLVEDHGLTEFHGVLTKTAVAIGPAYPAQVSGITGDLKML